MRVGELAAKIEAGDREIRYVLERGHCTRWIPAEPGSGNHRDLTDGQAFALALVVLLRRSGLRGGAAQRAAEKIETGVRGMAQGSAWDYEFAPFRGMLVTAHDWRVEIGDATALRLVTTANPRRIGTLDYTTWVSAAGMPDERKGFRPVVIVTVNLSLLATRIST